MKRIAYLFLAIRLAVETSMVHSLPYESGPGRSCNNTNTEYVPDGSNLCCKKCVPGTRFRKQCSATTETECGPCPDGQYTNTYHYFRNCLRCPKCSEDKGLRYSQKCSKTTRPLCECLPGKYCISGFRNQRCEACMSYTSCKPGHGVSRKGSADSDVWCEPCPDGTFSDQLSYTQPCQKHTDCAAQGSVVLHRGSATSDSVCETTHTTYNPQMIIYPKTPTGPETTTIQPTTVAPNTSTTQKETSSIAKNSVTPDVLLPHKEQGVLVWILPFLGVLAVLVIVVVLVLNKFRQKDYKPNNSITDSNGNFEAADLKQPPCTSVTFTEQQCLLSTGHHCNNINLEQTLHNGCSGNQENNPMPLQSTCQMFTHQTQPSSVPSSPLSAVNPLPSSPLVNVNITLNVGNGCCSAPSILHADSPQTSFTEPLFPMGKEEECVSVAQQEESKEVLVAVQESKHS